MIDDTTSVQMRKYSHNISFWKLKNLKRTMVTQKLIILYKTNTLILKKPYFKKPYSM